MKTIILHLKLAISYTNKIEKPYDMERLLFQGNDLMKSRYCLVDKFGVEYTSYIALNLVESHCYNDF